MKLIFLQILLLFLVSGCANQEQNVGAMDPLPSWNEGESKQAILTFVRRITDTESPDFIAPPDRIATFDNDGNLWCEQPLYFQLIFALDRIRALAPEHPEWRDQQPYRAAIENDLETLMSYGTHGLLTLTMASHAGMTTEEFDEIVRDWLGTARHPRYDKPYTELVYQPMLELIDYLEDNEFNVFIVSGGGVEFMRVWVEEVYGIPKHRVVGSSIKTSFDYNNGNPVIRRLPELDFIDDKEGKPVGIHRFIGRRPIFASGNSDGDLQMLQYTSAGEGPRFGLYLHHTDSIREYAYDRTSSIGRLDKGLDAARQQGWTVIDMKRDWNAIFPE